MRFKLYICAIIISRLLSYSVEISLSSENILIGDVIQILFEINGMEDGSRAHFPSLNLENEDISIYNGLINDSSASYRCQFWSKENIIFPPQKIYIKNNDIILDSIQTSSFSIKINSTISDSSTSTKDIKDNFDVYLSNQIFFISSMALLLFAIVLVIFFLNRRTYVESKSLKDCNYLDRAISKIKQLSLEDYDMRNVQKLSFNLSCIIKKYIKSTFYINAEEMTSEEILQFLSVQDKYKIILKKPNIFEKIDKLKFSNYKIKSFDLNIIKNDVVKFLQDLDEIV